MTIDPAASSTRAAGLVTVQLGVDLKREWVQWCADRNLVPGKALRKLVERALADAVELAAGRTGGVVRVLVGKQPDRGPKVERKVQLTPSENAAVEAVSKTQGFGFQA